jgi:hypothetical protein
MYFVSIYENRRMKPVEIVLRREEEGRGRRMEGVNPTKIYCKHICKYHMYPPVQLSYANKIGFFRKRTCCHKPKSITQNVKNSLNTKSNAKFIHSSAPTAALEQTFTKGLNTQCSFRVEVYLHMRRTHMQTELMSLFKSNNQCVYF